MLETFLSALDRLGRLQLPDVPDLASLAAALPPLLAASCVAAGALLCLCGARRWIFRFMLLPLGVVAALALAPKAAPWVHLSAQTTSCLATALAAACILLSPPLVLFLAFGALGAAFGSRLVGPRTYWLGEALGFAIGGFFGAAFERILAMALSSIVGAALFTMGLVGLASLTPLGPLVVGAPVLVWGLFGCLGVAAIAFQLKLTPSDEEREKARSAKLRQRELDVEAKAREQRFKAYSRKASGL